MHKPETRSEMEKRRIKTVTEKEPTFFILHVLSLFLYKGLGKTGLEPKNRVANVWQQQEHLFGTILVTERRQAKLKISRQLAAYTKFSFFQLEIDISNSKEK